ncbi:MAG: hypothetical protein HC890_01500 [Chloroflexaceae bacterium]|nr:hypothetical protein [Chloroflexaceae bacterium]
MVATLLPLPVAAQESAGCFLVDENGRQISLGSLCPSSGQPTAVPGLFQAKIKHRRGGTPVVDVTFNGQVFEMLVDTGATATVITPKMAEQLKIKPEGIFLANTPSDRNVPFQAGRVASVALGGLKAQNLRVAIAPALDIGLLGQNFFGQYDVTIKEG